MTESIALVIDRPDTKEPGDLVRSYWTMMRAFGKDLGNTADHALIPALGTQWFAQFIQNRKERDPKRYPYNGKFDSHDPSLVLRDFAFEFDSPYRKVFSSTDSMIKGAKQIIGARNTLFHFGEDPTLENLIDIAKLVRAFAQDAGMASDSQIVALLRRLERIRTGRHQPPRHAAPTHAAPMPAAPDPAPVPPLTPEQDAEPPAPPVKVELPDNLPRPRIGGVWTGPIPEGRYRVTRTGDILDPETFESLRAQVGDEFAAKSRRWLAVRPRGDHLWIAEDGAIGGWINEHPRLLGYVGDEPDDGAPRGFLLPYLYETRSGAIADVESGDTLTTGIADKLEPGTLLRLTTYGDVVAVDDNQGEVRVATVTADEWFPGHVA